MQILTARCLPIFLSFISISTAEHWGPFPKCVTQAPLQYDPNSPISWTDHIHSLTLCLQSNHSCYLCPTHSPFPWCLRSFQSSSTELLLHHLYYIASCYMLSHAWNYVSLSTGPNPVVGLRAQSTAWSSTAGLHCVAGLHWLVSWWPAL